MHAGAWTTEYMSAFNQDISRPAVDKVTDCSARMDDAPSVPSRRVWIACDGRRGGGSTWDKLTTDVVLR